MTVGNKSDARSLTLGSVALMGIAAGLLGQVGGAAAAVSDAIATAEPTEVSGVVVTKEKANSENAQINLGNMTGTVKDTPQSIQVISQKLMQEQKVTSLEQALRNVPGITVAIGEGGVLNGDQFKIRGQSAEDDVYIDGLKDFGAYVRDSFDDQEVQVLKGPSATAFGRGTTGAAINIVSKTPSLKEAYDVDASAGMGDYYRGQVDIDHKINDTTAVRLVAMGFSTHEVDRNDAKSERIGIAPSIAFGLGTNTQLTVGYFFQHNNDRPDYGVPLALEGGSVVSAINSTGATVNELSGATARPLTELGVNRANFYGFDSDHDITNAHMLTARFTQRENNWLSFSNDARAGYYTRDFEATQALCSSPTVSGTATTAHCVDYLQAGNPNAVVSTAGPSPYTQYTYGFQDIGAGHLDGEVLGFRNQASVGFDVNYEYNNRLAGVLVPAKPTTISAYDPNNGGSYTDEGVTPSNSTAATAARRISIGADYAAFFSDQIWLTPQLSIIGALRFDHYIAKYDTVTVGGTIVGEKVDSDLLNPKIAIVYQPTKEQTYYISYAKSATPQGASVADASASVTSAALQPEKNEIFEAGAKYSVFKDRLGFDAAVFQVNKNNALQPDPDDPTLLLANSGQAQRIRGVEFDVTGKITKAWSVNLGYSYLDTRIMSDTSVAQTVNGVAVMIPNTFSIGKEIYYAPKNSATLWTTYALGGRLKGLTIGGGVTYQDRVYTNYVYITPTSGNTYSAPDTIDYSSLIQYRWHRYSFSMNGYNLTNRLNYSQVYTNRVVPEQGRTFIFSVGADF
ncbi:MAG: TonB-dependent receptor [Caulobacteraceae bacterium]